MKLKKKAVGDGKMAGDRKICKKLHNKIYKLLGVLVSVVFLSGGMFSQRIYATASQWGEGTKTTMKAEQTSETLRIAYEEYQSRFAAIEKKEDFEDYGYEMIEEQSFAVMLESFGEIEVTFLPAMEKAYHRMAIFILDEEGNVIYKTDQLETNYRNLGSLEQPTEGIASVSFQDVNHDELTDIILLTRCVNDTGEYVGKSYKIGDVLFQGEQSFYRDFRISDKINRFSMNKSANCIISFVRDGNSAEILYTATTLDELLDNGFSIIVEQCYARDFEKLGRLRVVPGVFSISEYDFFMVYLVDDNGQIVWSFQPMGEYDNLYSLKGINGRDLDGDGMKDLVVLGRYSKEDENGKIQIKNQCAIYYQRTGGFDIDQEFTEYYSDYVRQNLEQDVEQNTKHEEITMEELVLKIREYWGWEVTNDKNIDS